MKIETRFIYSKSYIFKNELKDLILYHSDEYYNNNKIIFELDLVKFMDTRFFIDHEYANILIERRKMCININNLKKKHTIGKYKIALKECTKLCTDIINLIIIYII